MQNNVLYCDISEMILKDDWTMLVSRPKGEELRKRLKERISSRNKVIILDFYMVSRIDKSFIDSFLLPLIKEYKNKKDIIGINIKKELFEKTKNFKKAGLEDIDAFLRNKKEPFLIINEEACPYLFGLENDLSNRILKLLWENKHLTFEQICTELDIKSSEVNNALQILIEKKFIHQAATKDYKYKYYEAGFIDQIRPFIGFTIEDLIKRNLKKNIEDGHFELPSGVHVNKLFHASHLIRQPRITKKIGVHIADLLGENVDFVISTETPNNIILAHRTAQAVSRKTKSLFCRQSSFEKKFVLHERFNIDKNSNGLVVIDVVVTGYIVNKILDLLRRSGAGIRGICSIFDLSGGAVNFSPYIFRSISQDKIDIYQKGHCVLCQKDIKVYRPKILPGDWKW